MAKFIPILGELSGSIGANTWSRNKGGTYVRLRGEPTNPNTERQQSARTILSDLSSLWSNTLTDPDREEWRTWAAENPILDPLGQEFQRSGQQAFIALNARLLGAGAASFDTPPVDAGPEGLLTLGLTADASDNDLDVTFTPSVAGVGFRLAVWSSAPHRAGASPNIRQCRLVGYSAAATLIAPITSPQTFEPWSSLAGQEDAVITIYAGVLDARGRLSPMLRAFATVQA